MSYDDMIEDDAIEGVVEQERPQRAVVVAETPFEVYRQAVGPDLSDAQLMLAIEYAKRRGADLITKQIIPTVMQGRLTFITSIDFLRVLAERSGDYAGQDPITYGTDERTGNLEWAEATVYRHSWEKGCTVRAYWREFVPAKDYMWKKMPHVMLGKVAEAQALRKAFPADMSGLYSGDEMEQAQPVEESTQLEAHPAIGPTRAPARSRRVSSRSARQPAPTTPEAEASSASPTSAGPTERAKPERARPFTQAQHDADIEAHGVGPQQGDLTAVAEAIFEEESSWPEPQATEGEPALTPAAPAQPDDLPMRTGPHGSTFGERGMVIRTESFITDRGNQAFRLHMADMRDERGRLEVIQAMSRAQEQGVTDLVAGELIDVVGKWAHMSDGRAVVVAELVAREEPD